MPERVSKVAPPPPPLGAGGATKLLRLPHSSALLLALYSRREELPSVTDETERLELATDHWQLELQNEARTSGTSVGHSLWWTSLCSLRRPGPIQRSPSSSNNDMASS
jgi:hypothetical protein